MRPPSFSLRTLMIAVAIAATAFVAYWVGRAHESLISAKRRQDEQVYKIREFLAPHRDRYAWLTFNLGPPDQFHLEGPVRTRADLEALEVELTRLFGEERM